VAPRPGEVDGGNANEIIISEARTKSRFQEVGVDIIRIVC